MKIVKKEEIEKGFKRNILNLFKFEIKKNKKEQKPDLSFFAVHLVEHCNLNCKGCDHCVPLAKTGFTDINIFEKDIKRMSELFNRVKVIGLMGGEPLLHRGLSEFLRITRSIFTESHIVIFTNGILLEKQSQEFWETCKENKIIINLTKYPIDLDFKKIEELAKEKGVKIDFSSGTNAVMATFHKQVFDIEGKQNIEYSFSNCKNRLQGCYFLREGNFYPCTVAPNSKNFSEYFNINMEITEKDSIDIYKAKSGKEILDFISKPIPFCKYCDIDKRTINNPWELSKKDISEWT